MVSQQLINYIREQTKRGYDISSIRNYLIKYGYNQNEVDSAINEIYPRFQRRAPLSKSLIITIAVIGIILVFLITTISYYLSNQGSDQPINLKTSLIKNNINQGDRVEFSIELSNPGKSKYDVVLKYEIIGTDVYKEETVALETSASKTSYIQLPMNLAPKRYSLKTTATYNDKKVFATLSFNVVKQGTAVEECIEDWQCETWQPVACPSSGKQTRTCSDANNCNTNFYKPEISRDCTPETSQPEQPTQPESSMTVWEKLDQIKEKAKTNPSGAEDDCKSFEIESHKDECYYNIAEVTRSVSKCSSILSDRTKDRCISNVADVAKDSKLCEGISTLTRRDSCYMNFVNNKDYTVCEKIDNSYLKEACTALRDMPNIVVS